jgi:fructokinase
MLREAPQKFTMIDPNIRPSFITDKAGYRARLNRMLGAADIIKTSDEDLKWITGDTDAAPLFENTQARVILLTRGGDGVTVLTRAGEVSVPAERATVVDTVGAGDTFSAGFLAHLQNAGKLTKTGLAAASLDDLRGAAAFGAKVAAITVSRAGANPPWAAEL